jgi:hypothetical protein
VGTPSFIDTVTLAPNMFTWAEDEDGVDGVDTILLLLALIMVTVFALLLVGPFDEEVDAAAFTEAAYKLTGSSKLDADRVADRVVRDRMGNGGGPFCFRGVAGSLGLLALPLLLAFDAGTWGDTTDCGCCWGCWALLADIVRCNMFAAVDRKLVDDAVLGDSGSAKKDPLLTTFAVGIGGLGEGGIGICLGDGCGWSTAD